MAKREPWHPAPYEPAEVFAIQALARGEATSTQQRIALDWIIHRAAMTYDETFLPGDDAVRAYLQGRRNVGLQIVKLTKLKTDLTKVDDDGRPREA